MLVSELLDWYVKISPSRSPKKRWQQIGHVVRLMGAEAVDGIDYQRLLAYREQRATEGVSPSTQNRELSSLRAAMKLAVKGQMLSTCPPFPMEREPEGRTGWLSERQMLSVATYLDGKNDPIGDVVRFSYYTGWRKGAISGLRWTDVDVGRQIIEMPRELAKSRRSVRFPLDGPVLEIITRRMMIEKQSSYRTSWLFSRGGQQVKQFDKSWRSACAVAGCEGRLFHDLRRSFVLHMIERGVDPSVIRRLCDMSPQTFERYRIVRTDDLRQAVRLAHPASH